MLELIPTLNTNHSQTPSKTKQNLSSVNLYFIFFGSVPATLKPSMAKFSRKRRRPHVISSEKNSAHNTFGKVNEKYVIENICYSICFVFQFRPRDILQGICLLSFH